MTTRLLVIYLLSIFSLGLSYGQATDEEVTSVNVDKLMDLSLEDLMNIPVITPTQSLQKSKHAPATVLVVTGDQIKLRGYRNLAEVLNDLPDIKVNDKSDPQIQHCQCKGCLPAGSLRDLTGWSENFFAYQ
jgi:outer membrane receptor for ferrienterochelin and colicin